MESKVKRKAHASWCKLGDEGAILDRRQGLYFKLNTSATVLWEALQQPIHKEALIDSLIERWKIPPAQASSDVESFLSEMKELDLVELELS